MEIASNKKHVDFEKYEAKFKIIASKS